MPIFDKNKIQRYRNGLFSKGLSEVPSKLCWVSHGLFENPEKDHCSMIICLYIYIYLQIDIYIYTHTNLYKYIHPHYIHIISPYCPMQSPFLPLKPKFFTIFVGKKHTIWACEVQGNQLCLWSAQWPRETRSVRCQRTDFLSFFHPPWRGFTKEFDVDLSLIYNL